MDSTDCGLLQFDVEVVMKMKSKCRMLMFDERSRVPSIRISIDFQCVLSCHLSGPVTILPTSPRIFRDLFFGVRNHGNCLP